MSPFPVCPVPGGPAAAAGGLIAAGRLTPIAIAGAALAGAALALVATLGFTAAVLRAPEGGAEMRRLRRLIAEGARAFLHTQYTWLSLWMLALFALVAVLLGPATSGDHPLDGLWAGLGLVAGAALSAAAGYLGMAIATQANSRTAEACKSSMARGLQVSFASGAVMGLGVTGLALAGLTGLYLAFTYTLAGSERGHVAVDAATGCVASVDTAAFSRVLNRLAGFGFGASTIGMFARVGGGVFTKVRACRTCTEHAAPTRAR